MSVIDHGRQVVHEASQEGFLLAVGSNGGLQIANQEPGSSMSSNLKARLKRHKDQVIQYLDNEQKHNLAHLGLLLSAAREFQADDFDRVCPELERWCEAVRGALDDSDRKKVDYYLAACQMLRGELTQPQLARIREHLTGVSRPAVETPTVQAQPTKDNDLPEGWD